MASSQHDLQPDAPATYLNAALHILDPTFRRVTLENPKLQDLTRDLGFHTWPLGASPV